MKRMKMPNKISLKKCMGLVYFDHIKGTVNFLPNLTSDLQEMKKLHEWIGRFIKYKEQK